MSRNNGSGQQNEKAKLFWQNVLWLKRNCLSNDKPRRPLSEETMKKKMRATGTRK